MDLIRNALETICEELNGYLQNLDRRDDGWVVLTSLLDIDAAPNAEARGKIVMSVYNVAPEYVSSSFDPVSSLRMMEPNLAISLYLFFRANFIGREYGDGLAALSRVVSFFQNKPCFDASNTARLGPMIGKLMLEQVALNTSDIRDVVAMHGAQYLPTVFYRLRLGPFGTAAASGIPNAFPVK